VKWIMIVAALLASLLTASPALAQDLNCGDPGVGSNMPASAADPNNLDADNDGIACETPDGINTSEGNTLAPADASSASANASAPAAEQYSAAQDQYRSAVPGLTELPDTGGPSLAAPLLAVGVVGATLVGLALVARLIERL
jgi:Excalibur calcium-binding domain